MNFKQLIYFLSVAKHQHIGKAALELGISQSPLSRQIIALEQELDVLLFNRVRKRIILNEMGKKFLSEAEKMVKSFEELQNFRFQQNAQLININIGYVDAIIFGTKFHTSKTLLKDHNENINLNMFSMRSQEQISALRNNIIDIALIYYKNDIGYDLNYKNFEDDNLVLALSPLNSLSKIKNIQPSNINSSKWIAQPKYYNMHAREDFISKCKSVGFEPNITIEANGPLNLLSLVEKNYGIGLVQSNIKESTNFNIIYKKIPWINTNIKTQIIWRKNEKSNYILHFISLLKTM